MLVTAKVFAVKHMVGENQKGAYDFKAVTLKDLATGVLYHVRADKGFGPEINPVLERLEVGKELKVEAVPFVAQGKYVNLALRRIDL